ncbi:hypothetical protein [uncultured Rhodoblastus sp.]|uniref:hypothetical protein n=1 Tax=uncultured Rhodoblastus sp. TaxID=543037 RepID=UPI0025D4233B|nr:hypothetical protein [uncultured Rhodoblastus sp.]
MRLVPEFEQEFRLLCDFVWWRRRHWKNGVAKSDQEFGVVSEAQVKSDPAGLWRRSARGPRNAALSQFFPAAVNLLSGVVTPTLVPGRRAHGVLPLPGGRAIGANGDIGDVTLFQVSNGVILAQFHCH